MLRFIEQDSTQAHHQAHREGRFGKAQDSPPCPPLAAAIQLALGAQSQVLNEIAVVPKHVFDLLSPNSPTTIGEKSKRFLLPLSRKILRLYLIQILRLTTSCLVLA